MYIIKKVFLFAKEQYFSFIGVYCLMRTDAVMCTLFTYTTV